MYLCVYMYSCGYACIYLFVYSAFVCMCSRLYLATCIMANDFTKTLEVDYYSSFYILQYEHSEQCLLGNVFMFLFFYAASLNFNSRFNAYTSSSCKAV